MPLSGHLLWNVGKSAAKKPVIGSVARLAWRGYVEWWKRTSMVALRRDFKAILKDGKPLYVHIGAGEKSLTGWIDTDIIPAARYFVDATRPLPFDSDSVDLIFSEQFIEHIPLRKGQNFLTQAFRILKSGGIIRITTPSLETHAKEYLNRSDSAQEMLLRNRSMGYDYGPTMSALFNKMFYADDHVYIYDFETLAVCLTDAGFSDIRRCSIGKSSHVALEGIEQHFVGTIHDHFCLVVEGTKPIT